MDDFIREIFLLTTKSRALATLNLYENLHTKMEKSYAGPLPMLLSSYLLKIMSLLPREILT